MAGAAYPAFVQRFQVQPAESKKERPFIERNIAATRAAMNLDNVEVVPYQLDPSIRRSWSAEHADVAEHPAIDTETMAPTYQKLEALRGYYQLASSTSTATRSTAGCSRPSSPPAS